jgi:anti-anti-sigma regulatory factor
MLLDNVFSLGRRAAPGTGTRTRRLRGSLLRRAVTTPKPSAPPSSINHHLICLQPTAPVDAGVAPVLVDTVLEQVTGSDPVPVVVVLTLEATSVICDKGCEALVELHYKLRASGVRLHVGGVHPAVLDRMRESGALSRLGGDTVWMSLRTALLAAYEHLSGPAVVTRNVVAALELRLVPLRL